MSEYTPQMAAAMEWIWGPGFLSPGGREEVAAIIEGLDLGGKTVLDIGAGVGGGDIALVEDHSAGHVIGTDVDAGLLAQAARLVDEAGLANRITMQLIEPGPLPFADSTFDVVYSKDAIIHVVDKAALYAEIMRVLVPGGALAISDWLFDAADPVSPETREWLDKGGLTFQLETADNVRSMLDAAGFTGISLRDRNAWYREVIQQGEIARTTGDNFDGLVELVGREMAEHRRDSSARKQDIVNAGVLRPTHFRATKPV
jgi:ubiquinone/menaquinone biosynthesis C-methylase UbiE